MTPRDHLRKDPNLLRWWTEVVTSENFNQFELIIQSEICSWLRAEGAKIDEMNGAMRVLEILRTIADNPPGKQPVIGPGIEHELPRHEFAKH